MQLVVAGRQATTRRAVSMLVGTRLGLEVIGEAKDYEELMNLVMANQPDLILLDEDLPGVELGELIPTLRGLDFSPAVIVLNEKPETEEAALAAGADAFVYKGDHPKRLLIAVQSVRIARQGA